MGSAIQRVLMCRQVKAKQRTKGVVSSRDERVNERSTGMFSDKPSDRLLEEYDGQQDRNAHSIAVDNVKNFFRTYLCFDVLALITYLRQAFVHSNHALSAMAWLEAGLEFAVAVCFFVDILLAVSVLISLSKHWEGNIYRWEDKLNLISWNWKSNVFSLVVLTFQRVFHDWPNMEREFIVVFYIIIRAAKLRPLGFLVDEIRDAEAAGRDDLKRFHDLLREWGARRSTKTKKLVVFILVGSIFMILMVLLLAYLCDSKPTLPVCQTSATNHSGWGVASFKR